MDARSELILGDCRLELLAMPDDSVDLVFTSPPYADQRKNSYGGIAPDEYVEWFLPVSEQLLRVLKPTGSFVLNIKERVVSGERSTYVMELIMAMRDQGWLWTEEYIWHKKNCYPGKWPNRFRDAWERLLHFTKSKQFCMTEAETRECLSPSHPATVSTRAQVLRENPTGLCPSVYCEDMTSHTERDLLCEQPVAISPEAARPALRPATFFAPNLVTARIFLVTVQIYLLLAINPHYITLVIYR